MYMANQVLAGSLPERPQSGPGIQWLSDNLWELMVSVWTQSPLFRMTSAEALGRLNQLKLSELHESTGPPVPPKDYCSVKETSALGQGLIAHQHITSSWTNSHSRKCNAVVAPSQMATNGRQESAAIRHPEGSTNATVLDRRLESALTRSRVSYGRGNRRVPAASHRETIWFVDLEDFEARDRRQVSDRMSFHTAETPMDDDWSSTIAHSHLWKRHSLPAHTVECTSKKLPTFVE